LFQDSATVTVTVHDLPNVDAGEDQMVLAGETVTIGNVGTGNYSWTPTTGLSCTDCSLTDATPLATTTYTITVTNDYGCMRYDSVVIMVGCHDDVVFVPNAFSPNNDGQNDIFLVRSHGLRELDYLRVFDRWGNMIFESKNAADGWDGTYKGKPLTPGTYVYYMQATCSNGQSILKQGNITLIR
jgi:gliding motility-associated-like protein